jgi:hypothetical protein
MTHTTMLSSLGNRWERIPIEPACHLVMDFLNDRWKTIVSQEKVGNLHSRPVCCEEGFPKRVSTGTSAIAASTLETVSFRCKYLDNAYAHTLNRGLRFWRGLSGRTRFARCKYVSSLYAYTDQRHGWPATEISIQTALESDRSCYRTAHISYGYQG